MKDLAAAKQDINGMASTALSMLKNTFDGFIKHDRDILAAVLEDEQRLNDMEKNVTVSLVEISKGKDAKFKKKVMLLASIVTDLEQIGDYIKDMIERIEIKIEEKLLFSDDAVNEYKHLYRAVETELSDVVKSLEMDDRNFAQRILCGEDHVDNLVQEYRKTHTQRLVAGICDPRGCNMFSNLLDFTGQISHHAKTIAKNILEL